MEKMNFQIPGIPAQVSAPSCDDMVKMRVEAYNALDGQLKDYDCKVCRNKGYIARMAKNSEIIAECGCMKVRRTLSRIRESGLILHAITKYILSFGQFSIWLRCRRHHAKACFPPPPCQLKNCLKIYYTFCNSAEYKNQLRTCTFGSFETQSEWQKQMKNAALDFLQSDAVGFFIGGQSGCGKTHICTALVGGFIKKGLSARYFVWREDSTILKAMVNDRSYSEAIGEFKKADILYIDDLFKQDEVKDADKKLAFEIIDHRARQNLKTIISTELNDEQLIKCDEGLAGRILKMSHGFRLVIPKDRRKNYRLR